MKNQLKKTLVVLAFLITGAPAIISGYLSSEEFTYGGMSAAYAVKALPDTKGPLCSNGTSYCCKGTEGSCGAAACPSCS